MSNRTRTGTARTNAARTNTAKEEKENQAPAWHAAARRVAGQFDDDELEKKFDVEGLNTIDIVYARRENDEAQRRIVAQEAKLKEQEVLNARLLREIEALKTRGVNEMDPKEDAGVESIPSMLQDALEEERARNQELQRRLDELTHQSSATEEMEKIPRPRGSAGNNFNIRNEMGLGGSRANREIYKALLRNIRDLTLTAGIEWERPWSEISAGAKAKLFEVARLRHPILERYVNDWATEEIVKQFTKNKRRNGYRHNWLEVPEKYKYLQANSAKRDPSASRKRRTATTVQKNVAVKMPTSNKSKSKAVKGKGKASTVTESDAEDESMGEVGGEDGEEDEY
ncbi:hypothetical protein B0H11DRAFT_1265206 [Mycena galericulata]|nr:hypothetical protein B0H11DRAFT_1265206 [Mycena galericulata]